jgi:hypothetical protein
VCLAIIGDMLCRVELTVRPAVHIDGDPGDEDDRAARDMKRDRDLERPSARSKSYLGFRVSNG